MCQSEDEVSFSTSSASALSQKLASRSATVSPTHPAFLSSQGLFVSGKCLVQFHHVLLHLTDELALLEMECGTVDSGASHCLMTLPFPFYGARDATRFSVNVGPKALKTPVLFSMA